LCDVGPEAIARGFGVEAVHAHVPTATLVRHNKEWEGPLMGDKTWTALFDNAKIKGVAGPFAASQDLDEILADSIGHARERLKAPSAETDEDRLFDRIIAAQAAV